MIEGHTDTNLGTFMLDGQRVVQILINFLSNAIKFSPEKGSVRLIAQTFEKGDLSAIRVSVEDDGIGIPLDLQCKLFKAYSMIKTEESKHLNPNGNGLGLHICQNIAQCMDGTIHLQSAPGKGTKLTLEFEARRATVSQRPSQQSKKLAKAATFDNHTQKRS